MTDSSEKTGENTSDLPPQGSSQPSMALGDEGKRFGQAPLAERSFIQAICSAIVSGLSESAGKPHGSATRPELPGTKRSAGELDGPGDLVGKSVDYTSASQMAKHFRHDIPFHRDIEPTCINIDDTTDESAVQGEYSDCTEASAARWQASEELSTFLGTTRKPLSKFDRRQIVKDYPRPNVDAAFTPRLDSYLPGLMRGLTGLDAELREIQDKVLDIMGPLGAAHEHLLDKLDPPSSSIQFSREEGTGLMSIIQRSIQLAGHASATISQKRRVAVLTKINKAYASLGKEDFPDAGKDLFVKGFESRLKERTETAKAINEAKKVGQQLFRPAPPRGRPYLARGGSWNNLRRGGRQGRWQTRVRPFQQSGRGFLPPPPPTSQTSTNQ